MDTNDILNSIKENFSYLIENRRHLHRNPELSFLEFKTSEFIQNELTKLHVPFQVIANTGVVAIIGSGERCIALRADIDALPIEEETGLEYSSQTKGVMHACGHDCHTSMLLTAAKILKENENKLNAKIKLIFQPGEEKLPGGASILIEQGVLQNPIPEAIFGQHIFPESETGTISVSAGGIMASADELYWTISGKSTHAAQPHLGSDPILAASNLINFYQTMMMKFKDPMEKGLISVTAVNGGSATNIIPGEVKMMGTLRTFDNNFRFKIHELMQKKTSEICSLYDCEVDLEIRKGYPPLINNVNTSEFVKNQAIQILGQNNVKKFETKMWAEDFAYYAENIPACFWFLGVKNPDILELPPLHNPKLIPDENALVFGTSMFVKIAFDYFNKN